MWAKEVPTQEIQILVSASRSSVGRHKPQQIPPTGALKNQRIWKAPAIAGLLADSQLTPGPDKPGPIEWQRIPVRLTSLCS